MPAFISNSGYSASQISAMQQDAIERVREMQRRAREKLESSNQIASAPVRQQPVQQAAYRQSSPAVPAAPAFLKIPETAGAGRGNGFNLNFAVPSHQRRGGPIPDFSPGLHSHGLKAGKSRGLPTAPPLWLGRTLFHKGHGVSGGPFQTGPIPPVCPAQ